MPYFESIQELLEAKEGEYIQFKEARNWFNFEDAAKCCCALANNGGGNLVLGITDKRPRRVVGITLANILDRQSPRNRRVAEILSLCGMVERSGQGMNLMFELSVQEAKPLPDFSGTDEFFVCVTLNGLIIDKAMLFVINRISENCGALLSTTDFLTIDALYHERPLTEKMKSRLNHLIEMGIVEHIGRKKYVLARSLYAATGKTGVHTRQVGLDRDTNKELLLKHIRQNNAVGTPFKELQQVLPGLSRNQIQVLMRELQKDGRVGCVGKTSGARWFTGE